ncbi:MAG: hypothetical protein AAGM67_20810, partial [Bacteroidota bacterium]
FCKKLIPNQMKTNWLTLLGMALVLAFVAVGCGEETAADKAMDKMEEAADKAGDMVEDAAEATGEAMENAGSCRRSCR